MHIINTPKCSSVTEKMAWNWKSTQGGSTVLAVELTFCLKLHEKLESEHECFDALDSYLTQWVVRRAFWFAIAFVYELHCRHQGGIEVYADVYSQSQLRILLWLRGRVVSMCVRDVSMTLNVGVNRWVVIGVCAISVWVWWYSGASRAQNPQLTQNTLYH